MQKRFVFFFILISLFANQLKAQAPQVMTAADIYLGLKKLQVLGSVLYVAAHPDDENTRLLAYFSKEKLYRTGYLSLTRGDGGQNLIGNEQGIELGLIRTQELLAARRIDGAEQFFARAFDFGFSKSTDEALRIWDREKILSDVVWVIRKFQPDVMITRFPQDARAGHGHHSASAVLAVEAFTAAADPNRFPEQLKWVKPWQAKRILWNTANFGGNNTTSDKQFKFDVGAFNPILGKGYGEIAAESRSQHKSQGFGAALQRGSALEYFSVWKGDTMKTDLFDGVNTTWSKIKGGEAISQKIDQLINHYSLLAPGKSVKELTELYKSLQTLEDGYWKDKKLKEVQQLIEACCGLWMEAYTSEQYAVQTNTLRFNFFLNNRNGSQVTLRGIRLNDFDTTVNATLAANQNFMAGKSIYISDSIPVSQPYWLKNEMKPGYFNVTDQQLIGNADNAAAFSVHYLVNIEGLDLDFVKPVRYKWADPVKGELYQPVVVVPPVLITPNLNLLLSAKPDSQNVRFTIHAMKNTSKASVNTSPLKGWNVSINPGMLKDGLMRGDEAEADITLKPDEKTRTNGKTALTGSVNEQDGSYAAELRTIAYDHIPVVSYFRTPLVNMLTLDLKTAGKKIGYIEGAGDYVPVALKQMGYEVITLKDLDLATSDLSQFDAIITGVRAYNIKESLNTNYNKLMAYVQQGGNLIVQYNTSNQIGPVIAKIGPYNFNISRTRITDENATVKVLKPEHPILNFPNKITEKDFQNWIQERSIYHAQGWDKNYETIFSLHDPGEKDDEGSLITTKYGNGHFTYTGLVFFRELPAGVPGAYRLLANIIALNQKKGF
ncbi:MAG: PIG-L family deacetylase [Williamsia sp.]|nr:PIG-L family deacetylase [Williamsia sp.]